MTRAALVAVAALALLGLAAGGAGASGIGVDRTAQAADERPAAIGTRGSVVEISADGARVAIHAELEADGTCHHGSVWTPSSGAVVRLDPGDGGCESDDYFVGLTLAGTRVVWANFD